MPGQPNATDVPESAPEIVGLVAKKYIPTLDGWRAIAILLVIFSHSITSIQKATGARWFDVEENYVKSLGLLGVHIFFVISGFIITQNMIHEESATGAMSLRSFYWRRFFRIMPAATLFLLAVAALTFAHVIDVSLGRWFSALLFWGNYSTARGSWYVGHFWSLAVEEHFYFLWPVIFVALKSGRKRAIVLILAAAAVAIWRFVDGTFQLTSDSPAYFWGRSDVQADNIIWGATAAVLFNMPVPLAFLKVSVNQKRFLLAGIGGIFLIGALVPLGLKMDWLFLSLNPLIFAGFMVGIFAVGPKIAISILEWRPLKFVGLISYSLYLWQQIFLVEHPSAIGAMRELQRFPLNIGVAFIFAVASYKLIERPMIRFGRNLSIPSFGSKVPLALLRKKMDQWPNHSISPTSD